MAGNGKVLVIYTGGTIGMLPADPDNPASPLIPVAWEEWKSIEEATPGLERLGIEVKLNAEVGDALEPIDSSNMVPSYWIRIAQIINKHYRDFDGFVVVHGTDTMTYTATALSFLLENLSKPVILTGSQLPMGNVRNDAVQNLVTASQFAAPQAFDLPLVPEVCIYFHNRLLRANRTRKISSSDYAGFESPNFPPLAEVGEHISANKQLIRQRSEEELFINDKLIENVVMFDIFPGLKFEILRSLFEIEGLQGVVLKTYGAGNAPTEEDFLREIEYGIGKKGLTIVNVTQCVKGMVEMGLYDASAPMQRLGVISGVDMTPEAALVKMQLLLGLGYSGDVLKAQMQRDLRGELSVNVFDLFFEHGKAAPVYKLPTQQLPPGFDRDRFVAAKIRVDGAKPADKEKSEVSLGFFLNYPAVEETTDKSDDECLAIPQCLGITRAMLPPEGAKDVNIVFDCTERLGRVLKADRPLQLAVTSRTKDTIRWEGISLSLHTSAAIPFTIGG